jgi:ceramide glucosyltransferase
MSFVACVAAACVAVSLIYYAAATIASLRHASRAAAPPPNLPKIAPRVALLKPLHGRAYNLADNLTSYLELDYPRSEYVFGVSDYADPATDVAIGLKSLYGMARITLAVGEEPHCANHKVAKLVRMAERAPHADVIVVSDADVFADRDHLRRVIGELMADPAVGIVTCLYRARPRGGLASRLEALSVNTDFAPMVMLSSSIEPIAYALGATIAIRREVLAAVGGFAALKDVLADDYQLGRLVAARGYRIRLSSSLVTIVCDEARFRDFWNHQLRWARTYRTTRPVSRAAIVTHGPAWALVYAVATGGSAHALEAFALVFAVRIGMGAILSRRVLGVPRMLRDLWLLPFKDLVMTGVWFASLFGKEVVWRGRRLRIRTDGTMQEVNG